MVENFRSRIFGQKLLVKNLWSNIVGHNLFSLNVVGNSSSGSRILHGYGFRQHNLQIDYNHPFTSQQPKSHIHKNTQTQQIVTNYIPA